MHTAELFIEKHDSVCLHYEVRPPVEDETLTEKISAITDRTTDIIVGQSVWYLRDPGKRRLLNEIVADGDGLATFCHETVKYPFKLRVLTFGDSFVISCYADEANGYYQTAEDNHPQKHIQ